MTRSALGAIAAAWIWGLAALAGLSATVPSQVGSTRILTAQPSPDKPTETELVVMPIRDTGAAMPKGADGRPINERFTTAIRSHLTELAKDAYAVRERTKGDKSSVHLRLEGEMAHTDSDQEGGGGYLCTLRLYEDRKPRRLINQWSGTAATLRDLTSNLRHDPKFGPLGLLGELGRRVDSAVRNRAEVDAATLIRLALDRCAQSQKIEVTLAGNPGEEPKNAVSPGERYRFAVRSPHGGQAWALLIPTEGSPGLLIGNSDRGFPISSDERTFLPVRGLLTAPRREGLVKCILLVRLLDVEGKPARSVADTEKDTAPARTEDVDAVTVAVISTPAPPQDLGPDARRLLDWVVSEPKGTWMAQTLEIPVRAAR
jgi:hypothetical protein